MKKAFLVLIILYASCTPKNYFQIYQATSPDLEKTAEKLVFEDSNCSIHYNLWSEGGNIGFTFLNKTNDYIYLNLEESHFIFNGIANDYFNNRVYTASKKSEVKASKSSDYFTNTYNSVTATIGVESNIEESYGEKMILRIPPKTARIVKEFKINSTFYNSCDLEKYPRPKDMKSVSFSKETSPFVFKNIITYYLNDRPNEIQNEFWISGLKNLSDKVAITSKLDEDCGKKLTTSSYHFKDASPDSFYVQYTQSY